MSNTRVVTIHRTFDEVKKGDTVFFVAERGKVKKLSGLKLNALLNNIDETLRIRVTSTGYFLPILKTMQDRGAIVESAHWHHTGIAKSLEPEEIALKFSELSAELFSPIRIREDIHTLRQMVSTRAALVDFRKAAHLKLMGVARSLGFADDDDKPAWLLTEEESLDELSNTNERPVEKQIAKSAAQITECVLMNEILGISNKSWITSATVVSYLGDMSRFGSVAALWHYCGYHVVEGKSPKRAKGQVQTWNPKVRTALWSWADSMLKSNNPRWRPVYEQYKAEETAVHSEKHPNCPSPDGHVGARARRRVVKDALKEFYLRVKNEEIKGSDQLLGETHAFVVTPTRSKQRKAA